MATRRRTERPEHRHPVTSGVRQIHRPDFASLAVIGAARVAAMARDRIALPCRIGRWRGLHIAHRLVAGGTAGASMTAAVTAVRYAFFWGPGDAFISVILGAAATAPGTFTLWPLAKR